MTSPRNDTTHTGRSPLDGPQITVSRVPTLVDDVTVRLIAAVVVAVGLLALATQQWWLYAVLFADFTLRAAAGPRWSPIARAVDAGLRPRLATPKQPTPFAPKRFAAGIGAVMTATITALWVAHVVTATPALLWAASALAVVMIVLPGLEAAIGFCLGCRIFFALIRLGVIPEDACLDCAPSSRRA